jgi:hypothetical protein
MTLRVASTEKSVTDKTPLATGLTVRDTMYCRAVTISAPIAMGSMVTLHCRKRWHVVHAVDGIHREAIEQTVFDHRYASAW